MWGLFWVTATYGLTVATALLFVAAYLFARTTHSWSARISAIAFGAVLLCQIGTELAYRMHPLVWDDSIGFLPNASRDMVSQVSVLVSAVGLIIGAASLAIFAIRSRR
jgi:hypothetical protein